jgi:hypothetical protein
MAGRSRVSASVACRIGDTRGAAGPPANPTNSLESPGNPPCILVTGYDDTHQTSSGCGSGHAAFRHLAARQHDPCARGGSGQNLLWANENNPEGYWRTRSSPRSSSRFSSGRVCSNVPANSVLPVPRGAEPSPEFRAAKEQLIEVVARELNQAPGLWGFKDSRTSRLLPIWDRSVHGAGVGTALPPGTSQPLAVAASMAKLWETSPDSPS